ncbi:MAG: hypothetical protein OXK73_06515 [Rhodospirillaceae bacterium]|nr:hypothetical protein [Rhodospirillaceae bacterium]
MARISADLIAAQAVSAGRKPPSAERAAALAAAVELMVQAADDAASGLDFESEPANVATAMDETAAR